MLYPNRNAAWDAMLDALSLIGTSVPREYDLTALWDRCYESAGGGQYRQVLDTPAYYRAVLACAYPSVPGGSVEVDVAARRWAVVHTRRSFRSVPISGHFPAWLPLFSADAEAALGWLDSYLAGLGWIRGHEARVGVRRSYSLLYRPESTAEATYLQWVRDGRVRHFPAARAVKVEKLEKDLARRAVRLPGGLLELVADRSSVRWAVVVRGRESGGGRAVKAVVDAGVLRGVLAFGVADLTSASVIEAVQSAIGASGWRCRSLAMAGSLDEAPAFEVSYMPRTRAARCVEQAAPLPVGGGADDVSS